MAVSKVRVEWVSYQYGRRDHLNARILGATYEDSLITGTFGADEVENDPANSFNDANDTKTVKCPKGANGAIITMTASTAGNAVAIAINDDTGDDGEDNMTLEGVLMTAVTVDTAVPPVTMRVLVPTIPEHPYPTEDPPDQGFIRVKLVENTA